MDAYLQLMYLQPGYAYPEPSTLEGFYPHVMKLTVVDGQIASAVIDGSWDCQAQASLG